MMRALDAIASVLWFLSWALFGTLLFIASVAFMPLLMVAFACGRLSKHR